MFFALVAEMEYAQRLGRCPARVAGSNPAEGIICISNKKPLFRAVLILIISLLL